MTTANARWVIEVMCVESFSDNLAKSIRRLPICSIVYFYNAFIHIKLTQQNSAIIYRFNNDFRYFFLAIKYTSILWLIDTHS